MLACGFLFLQPGLSRAGDDTLTIALDKSLPGKYGYLTCDIFARALYKRLIGAGGEAYYIVYNWKSMDAGWLCHAMVVCRDGKGQYLGMDQKRSMPLLLPGKSPEEWIQWFNGPGEVQLVSSFTDKRTYGQVADLSRGPGSKKSKPVKKQAVQKQKPLRAMDLAAH